MASCSIVGGQCPHVSAFLQPQGGHETSIGRDINSHRPLGSYQTRRPQWISSRVPGLSYATDMRRNGSKTLQRATHISLSHSKWYSVDSYLIVCLSYSARVAPHPVEPHHMQRNSQYGEGNQASVEQMDLIGSCMQDATGYLLLHGF